MHLLASIDSPNQYLLHFFFFFFFQSGAVYPYTVIHSDTYSGAFYQYHLLCSSCLCYYNSYNAQFSIYSILMYKPTTTCASAIVDRLCL